MRLSWLDADVGLFFEVLGESLSQCPISCFIVSLRIVLVLVVQHRICRSHSFIRLVRLGVEALVHLFTVVPKLDLLLQVLVPSLKSLHIGVGCEVLALELPVVFHAAFEVELELLVFKVDALVHLLHVLDRAVADFDL